MKSGTVAFLPTWGLVAPGCEGLEKANGAPASGGCPRGSSGCIHFELKFNEKDSNLVPYNINEWRCVILRWPALEIRRMPIPEGVHHFHERPPAPLRAVSTLHSSTFSRFHVWIDGRNLHQLPNHLNLFLHEKAPRVGALNVPLLLPLPLPKSRSFFACVLTAQRVEFQ